MAASHLFLLTVTVPLDPWQNIPSAASKSSPPAGRGPKSHSRKIRFSIWQFFICSCSQWQSRWIPGKIFPQELPNPPRHLAPNRTHKKYDSQYGSFSFVLALSYSPPGSVAKYSLSSFQILPASWKRPQIALTKNMILILEASHLFLFTVTVPWIPGKIFPQQLPDPPHQLKMPRIALTTKTILNISASNLFFFKITVPLDPWKNIPSAAS